MNALIGTFTSVFEHADLWETRVLGDYILTGYDTPRDFDLIAIDERMRVPSVARGLSWQHIEDAADLVGYFVADAGAVRGLPGAGEINVDDHNFLETRLQRELLLRRDADVLASITAVRVDPMTRTTAGDGSATWRALAGRLEQIYASKALVREAWAARRVAEQLDADGRIVEALAEDRRYRALLDEIRELNPRDPLVSR